MLANYEIRQFMWRKKTRFGLFDVLLLRVDQLAALIGNDARPGNGFPIPLTVLNRLGCPFQPLVQLLPA